MPEQSLPTSPHPNCSLCDNPDRVLYVFGDTDGVYSTGEIVKLQESVHKPIQLIFDASSRSLAIHHSQPNTLEGPLGSSHDSICAQAPSQRTALTDNTRPSSEVSGPKRPAFIWPSLEGEPEDGGHLVCLMTGYRNAHTFVHLPRILQYFCMRISPHDLGDPEHRHHHHLHTHSEWPKEYQWFIGYPYVSKGRIHGPWEVEGYPTNFRLTKAQVAELDDICTEKYKAWMRKCVEEPGLLEESQAEYKEFKDQSHGLKISNASRATFPTTPPTQLSALPAETATPGPSAPAAIPSTPVDAASSSRGRRGKRGKGVQLMKRAFGIGA